MYYPFIVIKTKKIYKKIDNIYSINKEDYRGLLSQKNLNIDEYHIVSDLYLPINNIQHDIILVHTNISKKADDYKEIAQYKNIKLYKPISKDDNYVNIGLVLDDIQEDYYLIHKDSIRIISNSTKSSTELESISMYNFLTISSEDYNTINLVQPAKIRIKSDKLELIETKPIIDEQPLILYLNENDKMNYTKLVFIIVILILLFYYSRRR